MLTRIGRLFVAQALEISATLLRRRWVQVLLLVLTSAVLSSIFLSLSKPHEKVQAVELVWLFEPVERGAIVSSPLVTANRVYIATIQDAGLSTSGAVYCLDRNTGKRVWKFDDDGTMLHTFSSPCLANGRLYIGEGMHQNFACKLYCLDAESGRKLWHFPTTGHVESSPCVVNGRVFFGAGDDGLYCLDAVTGAKHWQFQGPFHTDSSPMVAGNRLYAGSGVSRVYRQTEIFCLETGSGSVLWHKPTDLPAWGSPVTDGKQVFFGLGNGRLTESAKPPEKPVGAVLCVDAKTGEQLWRYPVADAVLDKPAIDQVHVYFGCRDGYCYCLDRHTGQLAWRVDLGSPVVTDPALADGHVYVIASGGRVCCLEGDSARLLWTFDVGAHSQTKPQLFSSPAVLADLATRGSHHLIYFGAELSNSLQSAAALYCLRD
jgi:outer membrane protein assembly factor BamB